MNGKNLFEKELQSFNRGDQIAYIPNHAKSQGLKHPDVEYGFIVSVCPDGKGAFCRYWLKDSINILRTRNNSERTNLGDLALHKTHDQAEIEKLLKNM